ncbi:MAG: hypothetical protein ACFFDI_29275 [Promethearchaeota archaeon]
MSNKNKNEAIPSDRKTSNPFTKLSLLPIRWSFLPWPNFCKCSIEGWLNDNQFIKDAIVWETPDMLLSYSHWSSTQKEDLDKMFCTLWRREPLDLANPPPNQVADVLDDNQYAHTVLAPNDAWHLYLAYVANSIFLEWSRFNGSLVNWSLAEYSEKELALFFDSRSLMFWNNNWQLSGISGYEYSERAIYAPPDLVLSFLLENNLIRTDRQHTISSVLEWCSNNLLHMLGPTTAKNMEAHWQYRGKAPVSRTIAGTINTDYPSLGVRHWTAGCHGTNSFLNSILKVVNIPAKYVRVEPVGHATPGLFVDNWKYLSHGDDPYNRYLVKCTPPYPIEEMLIDQTQWDSWFGDAVPPEERAKNIGRQVKELAIKYLPDYLLHLHCADVAAGRSHAESDVYDVFSRYYTVEELEEMNLWTRIQLKINIFDGCEHIP